MVAFLKKYFALLVVGSTFLWSALAIVTSRREAVPPGTTVVLRIAHWQLETGVREAFTKLAAEYTKLHPHVQIVQTAIPEGTYAQWVTTQLIGGTAPDILELGNGGGIPYNVLLGYYSRYCLPLTSTANHPNPYNADTEFATTPWRQTFKDSMRNGYVEELQEYMIVPLAQFGIRIFYNKDLLRRLTGEEAPPKDFRQFLDACEKIKRQPDPRGAHYVPIAASAYHLWMWNALLVDPLTYPALRRLDFNRDGSVGADELFVGMATGTISFDFPAWRARYQLQKQLIDQFQVGFTGLGRDEAVFLFAQQRAVFIPTGTWDAQSLQEQALGEFELGVMDFPLPRRDDPDYGEFIEGRVYERPITGFNFAITRSSAHPEVATDFLQFLGSQRGNEELNRIIGWIPSIKGTQVPPLLAAFEPHLEGVFGAMPFDALGGETNIKWGQLNSLFTVNQISYEDLAAQFTAFYLEKGPGEFAELRRNRQRALPRDEQFLTGYRARAILAPTKEADTMWIKYRQMAAGRLLLRDLSSTRLHQHYQAGPVTNVVGAYDFSPAVIARVRANLEARP